MSFIELERRWNFRNSVIILKARKIILVHIDASKACRKLTKRLHNTYLISPAAIRVLDGGLLIKLDEMGPAKASFWWNSARKVRKLHIGFSTPHRTQKQTLYRHSVNSNPSNFRPKSLVTIQLLTRFFESFFESWKKIIFNIDGMSQSLNIFVRDDRRLSFCKKPYLFVQSKTHSHEVFFLLVSTILISTAAMQCFPNVFVKMLP